MTVLVGESGARWRLTGGPVAAGPHALVYRALGDDGLPASVKLARHPGRGGGWLEDEAREQRRWGEHPVAGRWVVPVLDVGQDDGRWFVVCAWLPTSLRDAARRGDRRRLAIALVDALAAVRDVGLVFPSLHLDNVRVDGDALFFTDAGERPPMRAAYATAGIVPSTATLAPEVHRDGAPGDDTYAAAACVVELLLGAPADGLLARALGERGPALTIADRRRLGAWVGPAGVRVLAAMLDPDPRRRGRDLGALRAALVPAARGGGAIVAVGGAVTAGVVVVLAAVNAPAAPRPSPPYAMVTIPGGTFRMGSALDDPRHTADEWPNPEVTVRPFRLGVHEVTQAQFVALLGENPTAGERQWGVGRAGPCSPYGGQDLLGDALPVVCVSWWQAVALANAWSDAAGLTRAYTIDGGEVRWDRDADGFRLPTEAEWERAARAGASGPFGGEADPCRIANVRAVSCDDGVPGLAAVGGRPPNRWGVADLLGNAQEWVWDGYGEYAAGALVDPTGPARADLRVNRGGSWFRAPMTVAWRSADAPETRAPTVGVRLARSAPP